MSKRQDIIPNGVERVEASVKWYNPERGYGFLTQENSPYEIMIHFSTLDRAGCSYIKSGDRVICNVVHGKSGPHVIHVIEVKYGSPGPRSISGFLASRLAPIDPETLQDVEGRLKWYNPDKGYGFILPDEGRREIFLHCSVLRTAGYKVLEPGARVSAKVSKSERGPEARTLRVLHEPEKETQASS